MEYELSSILAHAGFSDPRILAALMRVDRAYFAPPGLEGAARCDVPLPLGHGRILLRPSMVARLLAALRPGPGVNVLMLGSGTGYEIALLTELGCRVHAVESVPVLAEGTALRLARLGIRAHLRVADTAAGWPTEGPFDRILLATPVFEIAAPLRRQTSDGGRIVAPLGSAEGERIVVAWHAGEAWAEEVHGDGGRLPSLA